MQHRATSFIDSWNTMEHLGLVSAIHKLGDNNWAAVCNDIKELFLERPTNWFTPETCEAQYKWLHDKCVKLEISCERPSVQILEYLKSVAKNESHQKDEQEKKYKECKKLIETFSKNELDPKVVEEFYENSLKRKKDREESNRRLQEGLKKREPLRTEESDKSCVLKSPNKSEKTDGSSHITTSPLLSSLLNNPPAVQYRPTLSTSSFVPTKSAQGSPRTTPSDRSQTPSYINVKDAYASDLSIFLPSNCTVTNFPVDQSSSFSDQTHGLYSNTISAVRKLDFQEISCSSSMVSNQPLPVASDTIKEQVVVNEAAIKPEVPNLENLAAVSANDEYAEIPPDLLQVIDKLKVNEVLDKVISQLTNTGEDIIIDPSLNTVSIPLDESFISNISKHSDPVTPSLTEASQSSAPDTTVKTEAEEPVNMPNDTRGIIVFQEDSIADHVVEETSTSVVVSESSPIVETVTLNQDSSSFSSLAVSIGSEPVSEVKSDSESMIEYLDTSAVDEDHKNVGSQSTEKSVSDPTLENVLEDTKPTNVVDAEQTEINECETSGLESTGMENVSDETKEQHDGYVTCESTPEKSEKCEQAEKEVKPEPSVSAVEVKPVEPETDNVEVTNADTVEESIPVEENKAESSELVTDSKEVDAPEVPVVEKQPVVEISREESEVRLAKVDDVLETVTEETLETKTSRTCVIEEMSDHEDEIPQAYPTETPEVQPDTKEPTEAISKPVASDSNEPVSSEVPVETKETDVLPPVLTEPEQINLLEGASSEKSIPATAPSLVKEEIETEEDVKPVSMAKNIRKFSRKRRNTTSEATESKMIKTLPDVAEQPEDETRSKDSARTKELNVEIRDFREELDPQLTDSLLEPKEEPADDRVPPPQSSEQVTPVKPEPEDVKPEKKSAEAKESKAKNKTPRRSTLRNQNRTPSVEETSASGSKTLDSAQQASKKKSLVLAHQRLTSLKYSNTFLRPITNKTVPGYEDVIYSPIDLQTIKRKIDNKQISTVTEFQRDVLLMINNAKMFNRIHSQVYNMAVEVQREALHDIQLTVQALGEGILLNMNESNEKIRKRQSMDSTKKDQKPEQKPVKRAKPPGKDDSAPVKKIKLEENSGDNAS